MFLVRECTFRLSFPTVILSVNLSISTLRHLEFLGCFQLSFTEQKQLKLIFHKLCENTRAWKGASTNSHFPFTHSSVSWAVLLCIRECVGLRHRRGKFQSSQNDLMVSHAHKMVQPNQPLLKFTKKKGESWLRSSLLKDTKHIKEPKRFSPLCVTWLLAPCAQWKHIFPKIVLWCKQDSR